MPIAAFVTLVLSVLVSAPSAQPVPGYGSDSLILQEIADSLHVGFRKLTTSEEGGRVTRLSIYYQGQWGAIPPALGKLDSLRHLYMGITGVTSLPKEIGLLQRLDTIDIGSSSIGPTLPDEIGDLPNLRALRVSTCRLRSLPASLMKLRKLERVDFSGNAICQVDDSLRLWILAISPKALERQNPSECPATGTAGKTPRAGGAGRPGYGPRIYPAPLESGVTEKRIRYYSPSGRRVRPHDGG